MDRLAGIREREQAATKGAGRIAPWVAAYLRWQAITNTLASVAIEVPALRPLLKRRLEGFDGKPDVGGER